MGWPNYTTCILLPGSELRSIRLLQRNCIELLIAFGSSSARAFVGY
jgi:hypothetical protein